MRELVCTVCPRGCHMKADDDLNVAGNLCPRGAAYAKAELTHPTRVVTSTVRLTGGTYPRCPVKTSAPIPKDRVADLMAALNEVEAAAPVHVGDVLVKNILSTGADLVVTREIAQA